MSTLALIPMLFSFLIFAGVGIIVVYGFILLVRFLKAGTRAFDIYIEKNRNSNL